jgi:hypothetical protein
LVSLCDGLCHVRSQPLQQALAEGDVLVVQLDFLLLNGHRTHASLLHKPIEPGLQQWLFEAMHIKSWQFD